jgi:uncharacterized protein YndB with AHSA1/START domain
LGRSNATTISASVERVWALLTEPEHVNGWFAAEED